MPAEIERTTYTAEEFCRRVGIGLRTYHRLRARGEGPPVVKLGSRTVIRREAVEAWLRSRETQQ